MRCLQSHLSDHKYYAKYYVNVYVIVPVCGKNGNPQTDCDIDGTNRKLVITGKLWN